jgi:hypothetical protein
VLCFVWLIHFKLVSANVICQNRLSSLSYLILWLWKPCASNTLTIVNKSLSCVWILWGLSIHGIQYMSKYICIFNYLSLKLSIFILLFFKNYHIWMRQKQIGTKILPLEWWLLIAFFSVEWYVYMLSEYITWVVWSNHRLTVCAWFYLSLMIIPYHD